MNARIFIYIIIFFLCFIVFLVTYKFISCELKKASERMSEILVQCKTEEEKLKAMKAERRKNMKRCLKFVLFFYLGITILVFLFFFLFHKMSGLNIKPIGSYELFRENNVSYYGKYDYSIFCYNNGFFELSTYKIFDNKEKTVFETKSYEEFISKLEYAKPFVQTLFSKNNELSSHRFCLQSVCYQTCFVNFIRSFVVQPLMNPFTIEELYKLPETFSQFLCT